VLGEAYGWLTVLPVAQRLEKGAHGCKRGEGLYSNSFIPGALLLSLLPNRQVPKALCQLSSVGWKAHLLGSIARRPRFSANCRSVSIHHRVRKHG